VRIRDIFKRTLAAGLVVIAILQTCVTAFAYNNYSSQLGTNKALGSPILNSNFVADDWNKWEMIAWGVFLSNFATPLIDDYNSAFNANSNSGSKGSGYKALQFGSGSDPANAKVLQSLLDAAITQQKMGQIKQVYVRHTEVSGIYGIKNAGGQENPLASLDDEDTATSEVDGNVISDGVYRQATLADFIFQTKEDDGDTYIKVSNLDGSINLLAKTWNTMSGYKTIYTFDKGKLPTFAVKKLDNKYETVFDYTNSWDVQLLNAWFGKILCGDLSDDFADELNTMWKEAKNLPVYMDCFGNLVVKYKDSNRMLIPASANQYITDTPKINLINSLIFNGYLGSVNSKNLQLLGQQITWDTWGYLNPFSSSTGTDSGKPDKSGVPAFGSRINGIKSGTVNLYFDLDTIIMQDIIASEKGTVFLGAGSAEINYGAMVKKLFDLDIQNLTGDYALKIEVSNLSDSKIDKLDSEIQKAIEQTALASTMISNVVLDNPKAQILSKVMTDNKEISLLNDAVIIPVQADKGLDGNKINTAGAARLFPTFMYNVYKGSIPTTAGTLDRKMVEDILNSSKSVSELRDNSLRSVNGNISHLASGFIVNNSDLFSVNLPSPSNLMRTSAPSSSDFFKKIGDVKYSGVNAVTVKYSSDKSEDSVFQRWVKAYPVSDTMINISNVLGTRDGTDFAQWSSFIYMTYLDWYGVTLKKELGKDPIMTSEFNPRIFDGNSDVLNIDIMSIAGVRTEEDKKKDVLNYTYLMLHPTEGREYRTDLMMSGMTDWVYRNYSNIVYGNASSYYSSINSNLATRNATGFLNIDSYSDNIFTSWFIEIYPTIAIIIIAAVMIIVLIMGLLRSRKISWFLITTVVVINSILIIPATGEVVPYVANKYVQQIFNGKMNYWSVSEAINNANMEKDLLDSTDNGNLTEEESAQVKGMVKTLNVVHLDRSIMLRTDISRKITETASGNYAALQTLRSARWMLPMLMRQFSANDGSADYVYIPAGDLFDDMSNMYWFYKEEDAAGTPTVNARMSVGSYTATNTLISNIRGHFPDYQYPEDYANEKWSSMSYYTEDTTNGNLIKKDRKDIVHTYGYLLEGNSNILSRSAGFSGAYSGKESFDKYVENSLHQIQSSTFTGLSSELERIAGQYIRSDRSTINQKYGYLWTTENPAHYFYQNVKDTFQSSDTLGKIVGDLQGTYVINGDNREVRKSFMHSYDSGNIRDISDLEGLFRNTIPYLYQMMLTTGGTDGESGLLGDSKISGYDLYKDNNKSWMYRSNWVVKIMENSMYTEPTTVRDSSGNSYEVLNPAMPDTYPASRPMVFSEAQRVESGLSEADLTLVELKCININKNVSRSWTLLLNYANTHGMNKEVMLRQMALNTLMEFNKEFSPTGLLSGAKAMYPNSIDLRAISFDSVMKMLMINITKDVTYIQGDTMKSVVEDSDIFTALLLLTSAFLGCYIIPLFRNVVLAAIFYLGLFSIIRAIISGHKTKARISLGYAVSNLLFLVMTLVYYGVFSGLMAITTTDEVLTVQSVQVSVGNPVWCFIIIIVVSIVYIIGMYKMLNHCFKNFRDMGFEVYAEIAQLATSNIADKFDSVGSKIANWGAGKDDGGSSTQSIKGSGSKGQNTTTVTVESGSLEAEVTGDSHPKNVNARTQTEYDSTTYSYNVDVDIENSGASEIDAEIERGKNMEKEDMNDMNM